ncbi:invasin domain 3-containing protein [Pontibacter sp. MBLB2868]|uniref:invasin domain 3-containing protein n=1 Tax=Pontibacter sp. MBLB2868 TaxID=3451555 RepID=UPI003F74E738
MVKFYFLSFFLLCYVAVFGQTKGLIYKPATTLEGRAVLDPNSDGYTSKTTTGFVSNDRGNGESEIPYTPLPVLEKEPVQDLLKGPGCGFTDIVDSGADDPVMFYFDGTNFLVRFRLNKTSPNTKGYSVLIDTDQKFGFSGPEADPNAVPGNPGFEMELVMLTNRSVSLFNVDGTTSPVLLISKDYDAHSQKSIAYTEECGDPDYFYDFYMPWSDFGLDVNTKLRMAAVTVLSPAPAIGNNAKSDVGGVDDRTYSGNYDQLFWDLISYYRPTAPGDMSTSPLALSRCPTITVSVFANSSSVRGSSTEADGTRIELYRNGSTLLGTGMVTLGNWAVTGISGLAAGDQVKAIAIAPGKAASESCGTTWVGAAYTPPCTNPYTPVNVTAVNNSRKGISGNVLVPSPTNVKIKVLLDGKLFYTSDILSVSGSSANASTNQFCFKATKSGSSLIYNMAVTGNCQSGAPQDMPVGMYQFIVVSADAAGNYTCNSEPAFLCLGTSQSSASPVIANSTIYENTSSIAGTAAAGAYLIIKLNGVQQGTLKLAPSETNWEYPVSGLKIGDVLSVVAIEDGKCFSNEVSATVTGPQTSTPVVLGAYCASSGGATLTISGTSNEQDGTLIEVFRGATMVGTTTVFNGTWSKLATLYAGDNITAKAIAPGKTQSTISNTVQVNGTLPGSSLSINSPLVEGDNTVSGTTTVAGTIKLYIDGFYLAETITSGTSWTITGLHAYDIYAGGNVTATVTTGGGCESDPSVAVSVNCVAPRADIAINPATSTICSGQTTSFTITSSENLVIYELYNGTARTGSSVLGNGGEITLTSGPITADTQLSIRALKIATVACNSTMVNTHAVFVNPEITNNTVSDPETGTAYCGASEVGAITGSLPTGGNGVYTYQWQKSHDNTTWGQIEGATSQHFSPGLVTETTYYRRWVMSGACAEVNASASVKITIHPTISNELSYNGPSSFCLAGQPGQISGSSDATFASYQWQQSIDNLTWTDIEGATAADLTPATLNQTTLFRRKVKTGVCESTSVPITFTVYPALSKNVLAAPAAVVFCNSGDVAEITGSVPEGGDGAYTYRWQLSTDNGNSYSDIYPAVATKDFTPGTVNQTTYFRRIVESAGCAVSSSNAVKVSVASAIVSTLTADDAELPADGVSSTIIRLQLKDAFGTTVPEEVCALRLFTDKGVLSALEYVRDGMYTATLTAGTVSGIATITGSLNNEAINEMVEVHFTPVVNLVATQLTASPTSLPADGASTSVVHLSFKDHNGSAISVDEAKVNILFDGIAVTVSSLGSGAFEAVVPARTTTGIVQVTAIYNGTPIADNATVEFTSAVKTNATSITASPTSVPANGSDTSVATVTFRDHSGQLVAVDASDVVILLDGTAVPVTPVTTGTFTAVVPARTVASIVRVTATYKGALLSGSAAVTFTPAVNLDATTVSAAPERVNADGNSTAVARLTILDYAGNAIATEADKVEILLNGVPVPVRAVTAGVFEATVPAGVDARVVNVTARYDGNEISDHATVNFVTALNLAATSVTAIPEKLDADGVSTSVAQASFYDFAGNPFALELADVALLLDGTGTTATLKSKGIIEAIVPARSNGGFVTVTATYKGSEVTDKAIVEFVEVVVPAPAMSMSTVVANPTTVIADGLSTSVITVQLKDANGNPTSSNEPLKIVSGLGTLSAVTNNGNGHYAATLTSSVTGQTVITASLGTENFSSRPVVTFIPGRASALTATIVASETVIPADGASTSLLTITLYDANGNRINSGGETVTLASSLGTLQAVTDNQNGTYTATLTASTISGTATVSGWINSVAMVHTATVHFTAINHAPVAQDDSYLVNNHEKLSGNVLLNDLDPDGDPLTAKTALVRAPIFGSVVLQPDGSFVYTPAKGYVGDDSFKYQVCDDGDPKLCAEATVSIQVKQGLVFIPEGFSPDGDGENDVFTIYGAEDYRVSLKIFNRWGTIVYENKDYKNDWDGAANNGVVLGNKLPDGTYFYIVDLNNGEKPRSHSVIIKRN